jgi:hypothetical protein
MSAHVTDLIEAGLLQGDADMIGHVFWATLHGVIVLRLAGKLAPGIDFDALRGAALATLSYGLGLVAPADNNGG